MKFAEVVAALRAGNRVERLAYRSLSTCLRNCGKVEDHVAAGNYREARRALRRADRAKARIFDASYRPNATTPMQWAMEYACDATMEAAFETIRTLEKEPTE